MIDLLAWAKRFIATPSVSRDGNVAMAQQASAMLAEAGLEARSVPVRHQGVEHHAVLADLGPADAADGLILLTHLDTVPPGDPADWTATGGDPFAPTVDGDRLYGLGSADAKVDLVCKVAALAQIDPSRLRRRIRVVGTFAEEIGLVGARWLVDSGHLAGFRYALVGEPSELVAIRAHKGYCVVEARVAGVPVSAPAPSSLRAREFRGQSAHSSTPQLGHNAVLAALEALTQPGVVGFSALAGGGAVNQVPDRCHLEWWTEAGPGERASTPDATRPGEPLWSAKPLSVFLEAWRDWQASLLEPTDDAFDPDHSVASLGRVELRDDGIHLFFDLRPIPVPGHDPLELLRPLQRIARLDVLRTNPPLATPLDSPLVRAIAAAQERAGLGERIGTKATCTEAGLLASAGLDAVVLGAGPSVGNVHKPNEHTRISELARARDLYRDAIETLCGADAGTGAR